MSISLSYSISTKQKTDFNYPAFKDWVKTFAKCYVFAEHENNNWHAYILSDRTKRSIDRSIWDQFITHEGNQPKYAVVSKKCYNETTWIGYMAHEGIEHVECPEWYLSPAGLQKAYEAYKNKSTIVPQNLDYKKVSYEELPYIIESYASHHDLHVTNDYDKLIDLLIKDRYAIHVHSQKKLLRVKLILTKMYQ